MWGLSSKWRISAENLKHSAFLLCKIKWPNFTRPLWVKEQSGELIWMHKYRVYVPPDPSRFCVCKPMVWKFLFHTQTYISVNVPHQAKYTSQIYNKDALRSPVLRQLCSPQVAHLRLSLDCKGQPRLALDGPLDSTAVPGPDCFKWVIFTVGNVAVSLGKELSKRSVTDAMALRTLMAWSYCACMGAMQTQRAWWGVLVITNQNKSSNGDLCKYSSPAKGPRLFYRARKGRRVQRYSQLSFHKAQHSWPKGIAKKR